MRRLGVELCGIAVATVLIAGCNASSLDGSDTSTTPTNASATGVWSGTDSVSGLTITALINSTGQADFIRSDGVQFVGSVQVSGAAIAGTFREAGLTRGAPCGTRAARARRAGRTAEWP